MAAGQDCITLFLCADVMLGRGIDQIMPHPSDPTLYEAYVTSALGYVRLAEILMLVVIGLYHGGEGLILRLR